MLHRFFYRSIVLSFALIVSTNTFAQRDTIRLLQYNLLNYGDNVNPTNYKNARLGTIVQHVEPDIIAANEIADNRSLSQNILTNVLRTGWEKADYVNTSGQPQTNMLFWKSSKFGLSRQVSISSTLRDIIAYHLYYKDTISTQHDTVFLTVIVAHLKASSGSSDSIKRDQETQTIVTYLNNQPKETNVILAGDLNIYTADEQAYRNLVNSRNAKSKMYDPINSSGNWHNNRNFASIHTQSTRSTNLSDGGASGGMDDRFDFILASGYIMNDSAGIVYKNASYTTVGQDGLHFNQSINRAPQNTSAPAGVIDALYEMSDHLPVYADFIVDPAKINVGIVEQRQLLANQINSITTSGNDRVSIDLNVTNNGKYSILVYDVRGRNVFNSKMYLKSGKNIKHLNIPSLQHGVYVLSVASRDAKLTTKFVY